MKFMDYFFAEERKKEILNILKEKNKISVIEMSEKFKVSSSTIRNDLKELEAKQLLARTHGGALSQSIQTGFELKPALKEIDMLKEKKAIAKIAAKLIQDNDIIAIDTGTTTIELASAITYKKNLTVILNDLRIASYLEKNSDFDIIFLGGKVRKGFHCTFSNNSIDILDNLNIDKSFITCNGVHLKKGVTTPNINMANLKRKIIQSSTKNFLLCDSSKIENVSFAKVAPISLINAIVTDSKAKKEILDTYKTLDVDVFTSDI